MLGSGGFGIVYLAHDEELKRLVALKLPRMEVWNDSQKWLRFVAEAEFASQLSHPGIVPVYHAELNSSTPFIASQYCDGPNLEQWLKARETPINWQQSCRLVAQLATAVEFAHQRGVVHRDLKPANIMLSPPPASHSPVGTPPDSQHTATNEESPTNADGGEEFLELDQYHARLTDFGLAKLIDPSTSQQGPSNLLLGSPHYMSPEQTDSANHVTPATDIYSLGVILFELLSGDIPITGDSPVALLENIRCSPPRKLRSVNVKLPTSLEQICDGCLQKNPQHRYASAAELATDLWRCIENQPLLKRKPTRWTNLIDWCVTPDRVSNAGWFCLVWNSIFATWLVAAILLLPTQIEISRSNWLGLIFETGWGVAFSIGPMMLLGWFTIKRYRLAIFGGTLLSAIKLPFFIRAMFAEPVYFTELLNELGLYAFGLHFLLVLLLTMQLALFTCATLVTMRQVSS